VPRKRSAKSSGHISVGLLAWIVCGVLVAAAWWIYPVMRLHYNEQRKLASIQAQYASVTQRNQTLKQQVEHLKTRAGVEDEARKSLGMVGQGENVYVVLDKDEGVAVASTGSSTSPVSAAAADDPVTQLLDGIFGFVP